MSVANERNEVTMTKMIYVVYTMREENPLAVTLDREVACQIAGELEIKDGGEYWVDDIPMSHSLEEYKGQNQ